jgi:hypothetical protein
LRQNIFIGLFYQLSIVRFKGSAFPVQHCLWPEKRPV